MNHILASFSGTAAVIVGVLSMFAVLFLLLHSTTWNTKPRGRSVGRMRTADISFLYRMGAAFVGSITRFTPAATVEPCLIDPSAPPTAFGQAVIIDPTTQGVRPLNAGDAGVTYVYGLTVRPYPTSSLNTTTEDVGQGAPPLTGVIDIMRRGYMSVQVSGTAVPKKGGAVFIWVAASAGAHIQGNFEAAATSGSTIALSPDITWQGAADANGVAEIAFRP